VAAGDQATAYGVISISGKEEIFAIDGQHRVEGIREALKAGEDLAGEELTVIFVAHKTTDEGRERTRRLFTTLNKYAKPVSQAELIALNDDDTFAVVTRRLIDEYPGLNVDLVPLNPTANLAPGDKHSLTSVITLYKLVRTLTLPSGKAERRILEEGPLEPQRAEAVFATLVEYWDALKKRVPEIAAVCAAKPSQDVAGKYRTDEGGHLLLRPAGQEYFAKAVRILMDRGTALRTAVSTLAKLPMTHGEAPWRGVECSGRRRHAR
jgi:DNA sulfur modification protein DndB